MEQDATGDTIGQSQKQMTPFDASKRFVAKTERPTSTNVR
jgi:hypothetical protein